MCCHACKGNTEQITNLCTAAGSSGMVPPPPHSNRKTPHCSTTTSVLLADVAPAGMQHHFRYLPWCCAARLAVKMVQSDASCVLDRIAWKLSRSQPSLPFSVCKHDNAQTYLISSGRKTQRRHRITVNIWVCRIAFLDLWLRPYIR